jgi:hypothetical protein
MLGPSKYYAGGSISRNTPQRFIKEQAKKALKPTRYLAILVLREKIRTPRLERENKDEQLFYEELLLESFLNYPADVDEFPVNFDNIATAQTNNPEIQNWINLPSFELKNYHGEQLVSRQAADGQWQIVIPEALVANIITWYQHIMSHVGSSQEYDSIQAIFWFPHMRCRIDAYVHSCNTCQRYKAAGRGQGKLPPREGTSVPFKEVAVDLVGPWSINIDGNTLNIQALTIINIATTLSEVICIEDKSSQHILILFENNWLARYPQPVQVIFNQGGEFTGRPFQAMLLQNGIRPAPTTTKNLQSNAVCEQMHRTIKDSLRTICHSNPPGNVATAIELIDSVLASASYASRTAVHRTLGVSPGALVFGRDMLSPILVLHDYVKL